MALRNETIISWHWKNLITVAVMVTIGWFVLHLFMGGVGGLSDLIGGLGAGGNVDANTSGADESAYVSV